MGTIPAKAWESPQTRMMTYIPTVFVTPTIVVNGRVLCWNTELTPPAYADVVGEYSTVPNTYKGPSVSVAGVLWAWDGASYVPPEPRYGMSSALFSPADHVTGASRNRIAFWGSSTFERGCSSDCLRSAYDSMVFGIQSRMRSGSPVIPVYNGAVSGSSAQQIRDAFITSVDSVTHDISCLLFGANDLTSSAAAADIISKAQECVDAAVIRGKRVVLVVPHSRRLGEPNEPRIQYAAWCRQTESRLRGLVFVADVFQKLTLDNGGETPAGLLIDGTHLNYAGITSALHVYDACFVRMFGSVQYDSAPLYTQNSFNSVPTAASNASVGASSVDDYGRTVRTVSPTVPANDSYLYTDSALVSGAKYVLMGEFEVMSYAVGVAAMCGIYARTSDSVTYHEVGTSRVSSEDLPAGIRHRIALEFTAVPDMATSCRRGFKFKGCSLSVYGLSLQKIP